VTSFVFKDGQLNEANLSKMVRAVGKDRLVLDLSCRKRDGKYYIVTDRWQKFTQVELNAQTLEMLSGYCDEFLVHAADVEGRANGIEDDVASLLGEFSPLPATYAGGISGFGDLEKLKALGREKIDFTVGSALDIFGGKMSFERTAAFGR
jgi:phosphoribosylformimino-5-aminoimidazole carboxamide ribotide isomerase